MKRTLLRSPKAAEQYLRTLPDAHSGDWREEWIPLPGTFCQGDSVFKLNGREVARIEYRATSAKVYRVDPDPLPLVKIGPGGDFCADLTADRF